MIDINVELLQWSVTFLIKKPQVEQSKIKKFLTKNQLKNYSNQLVKNSVEKIE